MIRWFFHAAATAAVFVHCATAQMACPKTKAQTVPRDVEFHGVAKCGAVSLTIGGATISGPNQGCPLLAILVPEHEVEEPQTNGAHTRTQLYAQVSTRIYHFACERDYLLFIPWDSSCRLVAEKAGAALPRMTTVPCEPQTQAGPTS